MTVDHRPLLARRVPQVRRALYLGLIGCALLGAGVGATAAVFLTTPPKEN